MFRFYKRLQVFLILILFSACCSQAAIILDHNILTNSGFETGSTEWLAINPNENIEVVNDFAFTGNRSLKFSSGFNGDRSISSVPKAISYTGNTRYLLTINYFNTQAEGELNLIINLYSGGTLVQELNLGALNLTELNLWKSKRFLIDIPDLNPPADSIQICAEVKATYHGDLWLDDLILQPILPGKNMAKNPGFEASPTEWVDWAKNGPTLDLNEKHSGNVAAKVTADPNNAWNCVYCKDLMPYQEGDTVRTTFYYKLDTTNYPAEVKAQLLFKADKDGTIISDYIPQNIGGAVVGLWHKYTFDYQYIKYPTKQFNFYFFGSKIFKGNAWVDDVEVIIIPAQVPELVRGFDGQREPENIICQWQANEKKPFRYNIYMSTDPSFEPGADNIAASVSGELTNYEIEIPNSRIESKYYLAISAIDAGGQESAYTRIEIPASVLVKWVIKDSLTGEEMPEATITIDDVPFEVDEQGKLESYFLEGSHSYTISKPGFIRVTGTFEALVGMAPIEVFLDAKTYSPPAVQEVQVNNITPGLIVLSWNVPEPLNGEVPYEYEIYKSTSSGFEPTSDYFVAKIAGIQQAGARHEWSDSDVVGGKIYYYHVVAINDALLRAASFEVEAYVIPPENTTLISPVSSKPITSFPLRFEWSEVEDAIGYELQIANNNEFTGESLIEPSRSGAEELIFDLEQPLAQGKWFCRVRTCFADNIVSGFSTPISFVVVSLDDKAGLLPYLNIEQEIFNPHTGPLLLNYALSKPAKVTISVFTPNGRLCEALLSDRLIEPGGYQLIWQGRENGLIIRNGLYIIKIKLDAEGKETILYKKVLVWKR